MRDSLPRDSAVPHENQTHHPHRSLDGLWSELTLSSKGTVVAKFHSGK